MHTGATRLTLTRLAAMLAVLAAMLAFAGVQAASAKTAKATCDGETTFTTLVNDEYFATSGSPFNSQPASVLDNDTICEAGDATLVTGTSHGNLTFFANGTFQYTPVSLFVGTDTFTYAYFPTATDTFTGRAARAVAQTATVTIHVEPDCQNIARDDSYATTTGGTLNVAAPGFLGNDTLCFGLVQVIDGVDHGSFSYSQDGSFTYVPTPGFSGADSFTYRLGAVAEFRPLAVNVEDDEATVTIIVAPDCVLNLADDAYSLDENGTITVPQGETDILANDTTCGPVAGIIVDQQPQHGKVTTTGGGAFIYTPDGGYSGTDSFTYELQRPPVNEDKAPRKAARLKTVGTVNLVINPLVPVTEQTIPAVVTTAPPTTPTTVPPVTEPPVTEPPTEVPPTDGTVAPPTTSSGVSGSTASPALARTGVNFTGIVLAGFGLLLLGLVFAAESRRRKHT